MNPTEFKSNKLRGRIVEKYGSISNFSKAIGKDRSTISLKLTGKTGMDRDDIVMFCSALNIPYSELGDYFFTQ